MIWGDWILRERISSLLVIILEGNNEFLKLIENKKTGHARKPDKCCSVSGEALIKLRLTCKMCTFVMNCY